MSSVFADLHPIADTTIAGGWTNELGVAVDIYKSIDEIVPNDADYAQSSPGPSADAVRFLVAPAVDPGVDTSHSVSYRYGKESAATRVDLTVRVKQGGTTIEEWTHTDVPVGPTTAVHNLSASNVALITDYSALRLEFEATEV